MDTPCTGAGAPDDALARHERLVRGLCATLARQGDTPLLLTTPLSSVVVGPRDTWKLKKPVSLGFVDFSDAAVRRAACAEELRLNRRLAPAMYLGVVPIEGPPDSPTIGAPIGDDAPFAAHAGPAPEHAVWMRTFPQSALWSHRVPAGEVDAAEAAALGRAIGAFHLVGAAPRPDSPHGTAAAVHAAVRGNFDALAAPAMHADARTLRRLDAMRRAADARAGTLAGTLDARNQEGFVRDGHGDLHLANIVTIDGAAVPFDCLEFDAALRTVDVASEVAFTMMDLERAGRADLAAAFLDGWLELTGDVAAVPLLDHFRAYRAMVRAKVAAIGAAQAGQAAPTGPGSACAAYLALAEGYDARPGRPVLVAMHGLSGSGKSVLSAALAGAIPAVRLRSDLERKRVRGLSGTDRSGAHGAMYEAGARDAVYARLAGLAGPLLAAGASVVVDAGFLSRAQRDRFRALAARAGADFAIAAPQAPVPLLRERLAARAAQGTDASDADLAVLDAQLRTQQPLDEDERATAFVHRAGDPVTQASVAAAWRAFRPASSAASALPEPSSTPVEPAPPARTDPRP